MDVSLPPQFWEFIEHQFQLVTMLWIVQLSEYNPVRDFSLSFFIPANSLPGSLH